MEENKNNLRRNNKKDNMPTKKVNNKKNIRNNNTLNSKLTNEIMLILIIVISIIASVSIFSDKMGVVGGLISSLFKGLFGFGAYIMPFIVISYCIWLLISVEKENKIIKLIGIIMFTLFLGSFLSVFFESSTVKNLGFFEKVSNMYKNGGLLNGGVLGGMIGTFFSSSFGKIGSIIIILAFIIISIIMITGKSFFSFVSHSYKKYKSNKNQSDKDFTKKTDKKIDENKKNIPDIVLDRDEYENNEKPYIRQTIFKMKKPKKLEKTPKGLYNFKKDNNDEFSFENDFRNNENNNLNDYNNISDEMSSIEREVFENIDEIDNSFEDINEQSAFYKYKDELDAFKIDSIHSVKGLKKNKMKADIFKDKYIFPSIEILSKNRDTQAKNSKLEMVNNANKLEETLRSFGVDAKVIQINKGPTVTRYELSPSQGVKVSKIVNLSDDIALNLAATGIRIEAPIPGKSAVGIEVPNKEVRPVYLRDVIETDEFKNFDSKLAFALGEDIAGNPIITDIAKMPHLLIAGATGSGKSVCINTLITSILYKANPNDVKFLLIDPKVVELSIYNGIPHLLIPVVTDPKKAASALNWAVREMLKRYNDFATCNVRDIKGYNSLKNEKNENDFMPQIVIVIDELSDLMMASPNEVEDSICRLAQMARAAGIHIIIATQRPSVDVITGVIKANIPSRLAFSVSSGTDSRTILDMVGAEKLLGKGDMLFYPVGTSKPLRIQGAFVTDKEVENVVKFIKKNENFKYSQDVIDEITLPSKNISNASNNNLDEYFQSAVELVVKKEKASVSMLQRYLRIGYNRAANIMEALERNNIVGPEDGSKPRKVLISIDEYNELVKNGKIF